MPSSKADFAHPVAKTVACYFLVLAYPAAFAATALSVNLPWGTIPASAMLSLAGVGTLCHRDNTIVEAMRAICAVFARKRGP